jgi:lipoyl(octanoyl) transferase
MTQNLCEVHWLGTLEYQAAWDLQSEIAAGVAAGTRPPCLLLLEHPHTFTFGRQGHAENLLWDEAERARRGVAIHWVDRGGDVTYHGPGQLVGYPILPLAPLRPPAEPGTGYRRLPRANFVGYVRDLEKALIKTLAGFGLVSGQIPGLTGVWVQPHVASRCRHCPPEARHKPSKIAAIGVKVDVKGVTRHGFALNIQTDMAYWDGIIGCGLDYPVINMADLLPAPPPTARVVDRLVEAFGQVFDFQMRVQAFSESSTTQNQTYSR